MNVYTLMNCPECDSSIVEKKHRPERRMGQHGTYYVDVYICEMCNCVFYENGFTKDRLDERKTRRLRGIGI
jgi:uncharacterized protein with PIN domain